MQPLHTREIIADCKVLTEDKKTVILSRKETPSITNRKKISEIGPSQHRI